jgi:hypothetical protein
MSRNAIAIASVVLAGLAFRFWPSDERFIRRRLNAVAGTLTVPENDSELGRVSRVAELRKYVAEDVRLRSGGQEIVSRDVLLAFLVAFTPPPGGFSVELLDTQVTVAADGLTAQVYTDVKITSHDTTGAPTIDAREATIVVAKREGEWLITGAETKETLRRP